MTRAPPPEKPRLDRDWLFRAVCQEAVRDGSIDAAERDLLKRLQQLLKLPPERAAEILAEARARSIPLAGMPLDPRSALRRAVAVASADGVLEPSEEKLLRGLGKVLGLSESDVEQALKEA